MTRMQKTVYSPKAKAEVRVYHGILGRETDKAVLFTYIDEAGVDKDIWFPLSQVVSMHRTRSVVNNTLDSIVVSLWIAQQKELPV